MAKIIFAVLFLFVFIYYPSGACPYCTSPGACVHDHWKQLSYGKVKVTGETGRRIDLTIQNHLKKLDLQNVFLNQFRTKEAKDGFIGTGMLLEAAVRFAAYSPDPEIAAIKNQIVDCLLENQQADGYIGFFAEEQRLWQAWDIHEMAYIIIGLVSDYTLFGQKRSLDAAVKTADYIINRWNPPAGFTDFFYTGIDNAILSLYKATGEERFREFGENKRPLLTWAPGIEKGRTPRMFGHIFAYMAMNEAQLNIYRMTADKRFTEANSSAMDFLTAHDGLSIIGGAGQEECWTDDQDGEGDHAETCATSYLIRIYDHLLRLHGQSSYGDLMERSIYNALFAAQSPDGRRIRYYIPFEGERKYLQKDDYCCPNNFRRIISELPLMIYY
ncbi:MAG: glycoside hydrolase family 127 protein, partial [Tannerella sp.]|nr:glycoside hydrolase family 127 protein [Tannerella sp.]